MRYLKFHHLIFAGIFIVFSCNSSDDSSPPEDVQFEIPGPDNTGPYNSNLLVPSGSLTVDDTWAGGGSGTPEDPFIVENLDISGILKIQTSHVIVRNFRVSVSTNTYPVQTHFDGVSNVLIEDGDISGENTTSAAIIVKNGVTLRRLNLHNTGGDGIKVKGSDFIMERCWIHDIGANEGAHADGVQATIHGTGARWSNHIYRGNFFDMAVNALTGTYSSNATIFIHTNNADLGTGTGVDGILIEDNWLIGGNYSVPIEEGMAGVIVRNNKFGHIGVEVRYGNLRIQSPADISGNVYYDTLLPLDD